MVDVTRSDDGRAWILSLPADGSARARLFQMDSVKAGEKVVGDYRVPFAIAFTLRD
jgi:hypothetical protein